VPYILLCYFGSRGLSRRVRNLTKCSFRRIRIAKQYPHETSVAH
jgi:hypothetical protein